MKKLTYLILSIIILFISSNVNAYNPYDYTIDKYNIDIIVNENNTFDITENITAYFYIPKHGIYRSIPLRNKVSRLDGSSSINRAVISNLSVDNEYTVSKENGNYKIKIGSADKTITGSQSYLIKYIYNIGKDPLKDKDELYFNIIGTEWDTVINNVTFTITMPKDFDTSKIGFSSGKEGSTKNINVDYTVNENKITGSYTASLYPNEALTIRCELPEGYFVNAGIKTNKLYYLLSFLPIIFLAISISLWSRYGKDEDVIETVEFYPPNNYNSLEVGYIYKGKADNKDVTSLLIYLANKGYIKISEYDEERKIFNKKSFKITKLKDYDGNNVNEKYFLDGLFTKRPTPNFLFSKDKEDYGTITVNEVTASDLYDNFYITMNKIIRNISNKENKSKIFEKTPSGKVILIILMIIATYLLITIPPVFNWGDTEILPIIILFPLIGFSFLIGIILEQIVLLKNGSISKGAFISTIIFGIIWGAGFGGIPFAFALLPLLLLDKISLIAYIIGVICASGMIICIKFMPKRTEYGNEMLGKIRGFKNFLQTAEKENLEAMVSKEPTYFYDILPFTYVLGISDTWIKKFESINMKSPDWYDSDISFNMVTFSNFMNTTMSSAQSAMSSSPSSDSGGSGGGSSGGGSGGGGGGSW